ncbi:hypothetical protein LRS74_14380 [Streptomyces sp. LX-29]|uniref:hypothetical protein n=1 Tax=Streptomyces sp. LX-29 TaxID=2900152 RepID=UPI00240E0410|nr:hypothetical protein [Streptomyces sp. LX-29]WFB08107.1 hypothetical protein LRS74_14380 [Streptomyces sp. LX-29]
MHQASAKPQQTTTHQVHAVSSLRLLPWAGPHGQPCYLDSDRAGFLTKVADEMEAAQLSMGFGLLGHARLLLDDRKADAGELRFLAARLIEALEMVLRVAESRGGRLGSPEYGSATPGGAEAGAGAGVDAGAGAGAGGRGGAPVTGKGGTGE